MRVLDEEGRPLRPEEIVRLARQAGVLSTAGKTPEQTMKSKLSVDIRRHGDASRFKRTEPGRFGLSKWHQYQTYKGLPYVRQHKETVLVVSQSDVADLVPSEGLLLEPKTIGKLTLRSRACDRSAAEETEEFRQLVTLFAVLVGGDILTFRRSRHNPESRLHGTRAALFGGHLQPRDFYHPLFWPSPCLFVDWLSRRELEEELRLPSQWRLIPIGLLRDDTTQLGRQHLGFISLVTSEQRIEIEQTSYALDGEYVPVSKVATRHQLDQWSIMVAKYLTETFRGNSV